MPRDTRARCEDVTNPVDKPEEKTRWAGRIDAALKKAGGFLLDKQSADGAWRSQTYAALRGGPSLTPYVLSSLFYIPQTGTEAAAAYRKGVDYLVKYVGNDGHIKHEPGEFLYPVYTAAMASRAVPLLKRSPRNLRAQRAYLAYLRRRQMNEQLGWNPEDREYGGWGFSVELPRKPAPDQPPGRYFQPNLSATLFGITALSSAKVPHDDPAYRQILVFVTRCQNFSDDPARRDPKYDDGGFFFMPADIWQNKAGPAGKDRFGRERMHSYGTMTADGLRALLRCGLAEDHPRVAAARKWLQKHFSAKNNPGKFPESRKMLRNATYFYWAWAVSHAFMALRIHKIQTAKEKEEVHWAHALAEELLSVQRPDGAWINRFTDAREDDPLVATPWAAASLAICRYVISGQMQSL